MCIVVGRLFLVEGWVSMRMYGSRFFVLAMLVLSATLCPAAPAPNQYVLIDFGTDESFRGATVPSPDPKGNYWNGVRPGAFFSGLVDINNNPTTVNFGFSTGAGTDSYNGPAGDTTVNGPDASQYNAVALGRLGVDEAVYDYVVGSGVRFEIQGLDPSKKYAVTFYGSHKFSPEDTTVYSIYGDDQYTDLLGEVSLDIQTPGTPWLHNQDRLATVSNLTVRSSGILYVQFGGETGNNGYLNALQVEGIPQPPKIGLYLIRE